MTAQSGAPISQPQGRRPNLKAGQLSSSGLHKNVLVIGEATHPGETGKNNEDSYGYISIPVRDNRSGQITVAVVADGIGGQRGGEEAAGLAVKTVKDFFLSRPSAAGIPAGLQQALWNANSAIHTRSLERQLFEGMGTTAAAVVISDDNLYVANVGDSRVYLICRDTITQLSTDHSWGQEAVEAGRLSPEEVRHHPNRNVLKRYLGITAEVEVDLRVRRPGAGQEEHDAYVRAPLQLEEGDAVLICSDGLTDLVSDHEIWTTVRKHPPQRAADRLVQMARRAGGHDNITVLVIHVGEPAPVRDEMRPRLLAGGLALLLLAALAFSMASRAPAAPAAIPMLPIVTSTIEERSAIQPGELPAAMLPIVTVTFTSESRPVLSSEAPTASPTLLPMSTAVQTRTPVPTRAPAVTPSRRPVTVEAQSSVTTPEPGSEGPKIAPTDVSAQPVAPILLEPAAGETRQGVVTFRWQPGGPLPAGAAYEVVWWDSREHADSTAQAFAPPTTGTSLNVNLDGFFDVDRSVNWTVLVVEPQPYRRLTQPSGGSAHSLYYKGCHEECTTECRTDATGETKCGERCRTVCG